MKDSNTLLFLTDNIDVYPKMEGVTISSIYKSCNRYLRMIRYLHFRIGILKNLRRLWLADWKSNLNRYTDIVISDSIFDYTPIEYIRENAPDVRLVFCFRNRVKELIHHAIVNRDPHILKNRYKCELWSYNLDDCIKYEMKKYNQYYIIPRTIIEKKPPISWDVYFIGEDKHRMTMLMTLKRNLEAIGLTTKIEVVPDSHIRYTREEKELLVNAKPYIDVLECTLRSRCIIDIVGDTNYGMTYRSLEATVLKKKLLTNYKEIKDVTFYSKNNIFILGVDDDTNLKDFILSPFDNSIETLIENYSYQHFLRQIFKISK